MRVYGWRKVEGRNWWNFVLKKEDWPRSVEACALILISDVDGCEDLRVVARLFRHFISSFSLILSGHFFNWVISR